VYLCRIRVPFENKNNNKNNYYISVMRRRRIRQPRRSSERDEQALNNSPPSRGCNRLVAASKTYFIITRRFMANLGMVFINYIIIIL